MLPALDHVYLMFMKWMDLEAAFGMRRTYSEGDIQLSTTSEDAKMKERIQKRTRGNFHGRINTVSLEYVERLQRKKAGAKTEHYNVATCRSNE
ncbi:hypothetical protein OPV22_032739 [Ensete ventricosum]|uniref:Uncharacterized protein n=1 Tax=Ensete ventricosum TaxID=4639 RepID=A0AAV8PZ52_ENSVE|nr:hypothetical protein OPV22_032739 [Ensete ventricosum]